MGLDVTIRTSTGEPATLKNLGVISLYNLVKIKNPLKEENR